MRGVSLEELSSATRISTRFLTAIENGHWEELPGGAFNRGFIRSASRYLGLDEDGMVAEYALETSSATPIVFPAVSKRRGRAAAKKRRVWPRVTAVCGAGVLIVAGGWFAGAKVVHRLHARTAVAGPAASKAANPNASDPAPALAPATLALSVQAASAARVTVKADANIVFDGKMKAGEQKTFSADKAFGVSTSDAGAIHLELNGQPVASMGLARRPGSITLTAKDVKSSAVGAVRAGGAGGNH